MAHGRFRCPLSRLSWSWFRVLDRGCWPEAMRTANTEFDDKWTVSVSMVSCRLIPPLNGSLGVEPKGEPRPEETGMMMFYIHTLPAPG